MRPYLCRYFSLVLGIVLMFGAMMPIVGKAQVTTRASMSSSTEFSISADGRFIVFENDQSSFFSTRILIYDQQTKQTGSLNANDFGEGFNPTISADGNIVAFRSNDGIVVHNRQTKET